MLQRTLLRGSNFSRMIDLGGHKVSSSKTSKSANILADSISKNNKVVGVVFDFDAVSINVGGKPADLKKADSNKPVSVASSFGAAASQIPIEPYKPPAIVSDLANLLGVDMSGPTVTKKRRDDDDGEDDLSILGEIKAGLPETPKAATILSSPPSVPTPPAKHGSDMFASASLKSSNPQVAAAVADSETMARMEKNDPRLKYASLLAKKGTGIAAIESARDNQTLTSKPTDGSFHVNIRDTLIKQEQARLVNSSSWLVSSEMGTVLQYMNVRALKIGLMTSSESNIGNVNTFVEQLNNVRFHYQQKQWDEVGGTTVSIKEAAANLADKPAQLILVSSVDKSLKEARDLGMFTCRVLVPNGRRGITCNWEIKNLEELPDVVNEINGISFSAVRSIGNSKVDYR
jgi:hypothetical protein